MLGEHDLVLQGGEAVEFDTRGPYWFDGAGPEAVELLSLFGPQGEKSMTETARNESIDSSDGTCWRRALAR